MCLFLLLLLAYKYYKFYNRRFSRRTRRSPFAVRPPLLAPWYNDNNESELRTSGFFPFHTFFPPFFFFSFFFLFSLLSKIAQRYSYRYYYVSGTLQHFSIVPAAFSHLVSLVPLISFLTAPKTAILFLSYLILNNSTPPGPCPVINSALTDGCAEPFGERAPNSGPGRAIRN